MKSKSSFPSALKYILAILLSGIFGYQLSAQVITNYSFSTSTGTFTPHAGATAPTLSGNADDGTFSNLSIGFDFWYMGSRYTTVSASTNGWLALGSSISDDYNNSLSTHGTRPLIAPLWDDLNITTASNVTYHTTGAAGARIFSIQYLNVRWNYQAYGNVLSFQVKLYESSGKIEFVYRADTYGANSPSASIGIAGTATGSGNFLSVNNAGTSVSSTIEANVTSKPVTGKTYAFASPIPAAPASLTFSGVTQAAMQLNWTNLATNETGYVIYRSTDGANYSFVTETAANATSSVQTGLAANTTYYWRVFAVSEGGLSTALPGKRATVCASPPAAPIVSTPVKYCLNAAASPLTATGTSLTWGSANATVSGTAGGTAPLPNAVYADGSYSNKKTLFTALEDGVTISTVDYYISANQTSNAIVLAIFNNAGTILAKSSTTTSLTAGANAVKVANVFNYELPAAGNYSIGLASGFGNLAFDSPSYPMTEASGTLTVTGASGNQCFNNIQFTTSQPGTTAPTPLTGVEGSKNYIVTQTVGGCVSPEATISVVVSQAPSATIAYAGSAICKSAGVQVVTRSGTIGGTYSAGAGLSINTSTGAIIASTSTPGSYTVTYLIPAGGGCSAFSATTSVSITNAPAATISYPSSPYCSSTGTATVIFSGSAGGIYTSTAGIAINSSTGEVNLAASTPGTYTVTYTIVASGGCAVFTTNTSITISASPDIEQLSTTGLIAHYRMEGNANDATGINPATLQNNPAQATDRFGVAGNALQFNGSSNYISTAKSYVNPGNFTISIWFKTSTTTGGKLIGFGTTSVGQSGQYDRHLYMNNAGQLYFGIYNNAVITVNSQLSYNDNKWHLATATLSNVSGMALYLDGTQVGSNASGLAGENYTGYWKIGFDNTNAWTSQPSSYFFNGTLDDALIYDRTLSPAEVGVLYSAPDGAANNGPICAGSPINLSGTTVSGATYSWTGPNSFTSSANNPSVAYSPAAIGTYKFLVTKDGCTSDAFTNVVLSAEPGQWTGNISTSWTDPANWCSGALPLASTDVTIPATATRMPSITAAATCNNISIASGATLTITLTGTLNIAGTATNSGTITNAGTVNFNGTGGQQTFSGLTQFHNLTISNAAGLLLPNGIIVNNTLTLAAGTLSANNFNVQVKGNWVNNSSISAFAAGSSTVTFAGSAAQSIGGTFATSFNNLVVSNTGNIVSLLVNTSISNDLIVSAGTFNLSTFLANRATPGGTLSVANTATLRIGGANGFPTGFTTNTLVANSTVEYAGTNQPVANVVYGNLRLTSATGAAVKTMPAGNVSIIGNLTTDISTGSAVSFTAASDLTVNGNVVLGSATTFNAGSFTHAVAGNWTNSGTFTGNTGTITFTGAGTTVGGNGVHNFNNLTIAAPSVSFSNASMQLAGNLSTTGSGAFVQANGGTLTMSGSGKTITGSGITLDNLTITGAVTTPATFSITGNLAVAGSVTATDGIITMSGGGKTIAGAGTIAFKALSVTGSVTTAVGFSINGALNVNGSFSASAGTAMFKGSSSISGIANLYHVTASGTTLQLTANASLGIAGVLTLQTGTLDVTSSTPNTVDFNGGNQTVNGLTYDKLVLSNGSVKTAVAAVTANNDFAIGSGTSFVPGSLTHNFKRNWINNGSFTAGSSTILFTGSTSSNITGATTFNILTVEKATAATKVQLQQDISAGTVNMVSGAMATGTNTLTITTTRTGAGIITGIVKRMHAFTTGTAYAFEGPQNTISFGSLSGVTSVTVKITLGSVLDFPNAAAINRQYTVIIPSGTYNASLRLHYEQDELGGNDEATMPLWRNTGSAWVSAGKTGNDITANYVEAIALTDITGRWTLSNNTSNLNVVGWNGSASSDWNDATNWTVLDGSPSRPPAAADIVKLGSIAFAYQPSISTAVSVKNIVFESVQAVNLTLAPGGSLETSGTINGIWNTSRTHSIIVNNQNLLVNGDIMLGDGVAGHVINLQIGAGTAATMGSLTQSGGSSIVFSGAGTLGIHNDFNYTDGTFTAGAGTVAYNGQINQDIGAVAYNNLSINKTDGVAFVNSPLTLAGNLQVLGGHMENADVMTIAGNVTISATAYLINRNVLQVKGNWVNNGTFTAPGGSIYFNGNGSQGISATTFNNVFIDKPVGSIATLTGNVNIQGNLNFTSGSLDAKTFEFDRVVTGGSAQFGDSATLLVAGNNLPSGFAAYTISPASTCIFNGTGAQALFLPEISMGHIILRNSGIKTLMTPINVAGNFTIENPASFLAGSNIISLAGNWINQGSFSAQTGEMLLTGLGKTISGTTTFNKVTISGAYTQAANITYDQMLTITATGSISSGSGIFTTMNGDLLNMGVLNTSGTTTFTGLREQTLSLMNATTFALTVNFNGSVSPKQNSTSAPQYGYLNINNTAGVSPSVGWAVVYAMNVGVGAWFNGGTSTHNFLGNLANNGRITSEGTMNFIPAGAAVVDLGANFTSKGTVVFGGAGSMTLAATKPEFTNVTVSNTNVAGITAPGAWTILQNFRIHAGATFNAGAFTDTIGGNITVLGTFNCGTSTLVLSGSSIQEISSASAFHNLTVNQTGGTVSLLAPATIDGNLHFLKGNITTGAHAVLLPVASTVTGASQGTGWVYGNIARSIGTGASTNHFQVGDIDTYTPVSVNFGNVTTGGTLTAATVKGDHPAIAGSVLNKDLSVNRYWKFTNNGVNFDQYSSTFNFSPADVDAGANTASFRVGMYNGSSWTMPALSGIDVTSIMATAVTSTGEFAIGEACNAGTAISYPVSIVCSNAGMVLVDRTGTGGGAYTSASGLSLDQVTGQINPATSIAGTYSIAYTIPASGSCPIYPTTSSIIITAAPSATITYTGTPFRFDGGMAEVTLAGTTGGAFTAEPGLAINAVTGQVDLAASAGGSYTITYTVAANGGCAAFTTTTTISITGHKTWDGGAGTSNWGDADNWNSNGVPTAADIVDLTGADVIDVNVAAVSNDLLLNNAALVLNVTAGHSLSVSGNLTVAMGTLNTAASFPTVSGIIDLSSGTVGFNGAGLQTIPALAYYNLVSSSTGARTLGTDTSIRVRGMFTPGTNAYTVTGSRIDYNGSAAQTIATFNYYNLGLCKAGIKTFAAGTSGIAGSLTLNGTAAADAMANNSTINYNGADSQVVTDIPYYNLGMANSSGGITILNAAINNDLLVSAGVARIGASANQLTINVAGRIVVSAGAILSNAGNTPSLHLLNLMGNLENNGTFNMSPAVKTSFNGSTNQVISGTGNPVFQDLTITNAAGVSAGNMTVMGVLDLDQVNPSATEGLLHLASGVLDMGASSTTSGPGDATGIIRRTQLLSGIEYSFGNTFSSAIFQGVGDIPDEMSFRVALGTAPSWKPDAISRVYDVSYKHGLNFHGSVRFHYLDNELNGNDKNQLVVFRYIMDPGMLIESGRSNFNTTDNWVELGNINGNEVDSVDFGVMEWGLAAQQAEARTWNGSSDSLWYNPLNWTGGVPGPDDDVIIPDASTTPNDPVLADSATVKSISILRDAILYGRNGRLFLEGSEGAWLDNGLFANDSSEVIFKSAAATIAGESNFYDITIDTGAQLTMSNAQVMQIFGTMTNRGIWNVSFVANTVLYAGSSQVVPNPNGSTGGYHDLILRGEGFKNLPATDMRINDALMIEDPVMVTAASKLSIGGDFSLAAPSTFNAGGFDHMVGGNWINTGNFVAGTNTITMNGSMPQSIEGNPTTFYNLSITKNGAAVTSNTNLLVGGNLSVLAGRFDLGQYSANRITPGGTLTVADSATLLIGGTNTIPENYTNHTIGSASVIEYKGTSQEVSPLNSLESYGSLIISGAGIKTITGNTGVKHLVVRTGNELSVGENTLRIGGEIQNEGLISASDATVELNGSVHQTIPSSTFNGNLLKSLTVRNTAGADLAGTLNLTDVLLIADGSLATGGYLTLKSSATATARVATITSLSATPITGNVTVERYVMGRRKYRLITSSVTTYPSSGLTAGQEDLSIWGNWQNQGNNTGVESGNFITGGTTTDGFDQQTNKASLFTYDDVNRSYVGYTSANGRNTKYTSLKAGVAFYMFVYGDRRNTITTSNPNNTVIRATGLLTTGDHLYNTSSSIPLSGVNGRYTLLGNPYASPINWATLPRTDITDTYWGWDPNFGSTGGYVTVSTLGSVTITSPYSGTTGLNQYIQSGQGFFVKTSGASPSLTIREQDKTPEFNASAFRFTGSSLPLIAVNLQYPNGPSKMLADGVVAVFDNEFANSVGEGDASKMLGTAETVSISNSGELLSIDARKMPQAADTIFLNTGGLVKPQYTLQIFAKQMEGSTALPYLRDRYLNSTVALSLNDTNRIDITVTPSVPASFDKNRFSIVFRSNAVLPVKFVSVTGTRVNNEVAVKWEVAEESGITGYEVQRSVNGTDFKAIGKVAAGVPAVTAYGFTDIEPASGVNYYRIRAMELSGNMIFSNMVMVKMETGPASVSVYPNPIREGQVNYYLSGSETGQYNISLFDSGGSRIIGQQINYTGGSYGGKLQVHQLKAGVYYLEIKNKTNRYVHNILVP